jgi:hypothetical protein
MFFFLTKLVGNAYFINMLRTAQVIAIQLLIYEKNLRFILPATVITFLGMTYTSFVNVRVTDIHKHELSLIKMYCSSIEAQSVYNYKRNQRLKDIITLHVAFEQRNLDHMQTEKTVTEIRFMRRKISYIHLDCKRYLNVIK